MLLYPMVLLSRRYAYKNFPTTVVKTGVECPIWQISQPNHPATIGPPSLYGDGVLKRPGIIFSTRYWSNLMNTAFMILDAYAHF